MKTIIKKLISRTLIILSVLIFFSCGIGFSGKKLTPPGIYECKPGEGFIAPTYKFNSLDERTLIWVGDGQGFEFYDLNSKKMVMLYERSGLQYTCKCIDTIIASDSISEN
jgi:hypothetical protein